MQPGRRAVVWVDSARIGFIKRVLSAAEVAPVGAGSPVRGQSAIVAGELGCPTADDLRAVLADASREFDLLLLANPGDFGSDPAGDDARAIRAAHARGVRVVSLEPIPASALELASPGWSHAANPAIEGVRLIPLVRRSPAFREAAEPIVNFGPVTAVGVEHFSPAEECSLGAALVSALDVVASLLGEPEVIDAAYAAPGSADGAPIHLLPAETLRDLHGDFTANLRFSTGRCAAILASDRAGRFNRAVTILGPSGRLRVYDDGFEWLSPSGRKLDEHRFRRARDMPAPESHADHALADSLTRFLDPATPDDGPSDTRSLLRVAHAALLSARTGQPEAPETIRAMSGD